MTDYIDRLVAPSLQVYLCFPNGDARFVSHIYHLAIYNVGDNLIISGETQVYKIVDIQHQIERGDNEVLTYIMTNIVLEETFLT